MNRRVRRFLAVSSFFCSLAVLVAVATPAVAVTGLENRVSSSAKDSTSPKIQIARCSAGNRVIGGGGVVETLSDEPEEYETKVILTGLEPIHDTLNRDGYMAVGYETTPGIPGRWYLQAYAICADPLAGLEIASSTTDPSSSRFKKAAAKCPGSKKVLGTGARVPDTRGRVGLQLTRASGPRDISRATAREGAGGYARPWTLSSYAVCANPIGGPPIAEVVNDDHDAVGCPAGTFALGVGGGGGLTDSGAFFLQMMYPPRIFPEPRSVEVKMTGVPNEGMVLQAVCAA